MICGMDNGELVYIKINFQCCFKIFNEIKNYNKDIQRIVKKLIKAKNPKEIEVKYIFPEEKDRNSIILITRLFDSIIHNIKLDDNDEYVIVAPYWMDCRTDSYSEMSKIVDDVISTSIDNTPIPSNFI